VARTRLVGCDWVVSQLDQCLCLLREDTLLKQAGADCYCTPVSVKTQASLHCNMCLDKFSFHSCPACWCLYQNTMLFGFTDNFNKNGMSAGCGVMKLPPEEIVSTHFSFPIKIVHWKYLLLKVVQTVVQSMSVS